MPLSLEEVQHIAKLARLELKEEELEQFREQLSAVLTYASTLRNLDTSGILPTSRVLASSCKLRDDQPRNGLDQQDLFKNTKYHREGQFVVPPVFDSD